VFNEGYSGTGGTGLRPDFSAEAIRLARLVVDSMPGEAEARGLLALELLHESRRARPAGGEALVPLEEQDRSRWDRAKIGEEDSDPGRALACASRGLSRFRPRSRRCTRSCVRGADRLATDRGAVRIALSACCTTVSSH
jgi:predicted RNA polymerase sigma factor